MAFNWRRYRRSFPSPRPGPGTGGRLPPYGGRMAPRVKWVPALQDPAAGSLISANAVTTTLILDYGAGGLTADPVEFEDYDLRLRVIHLWLDGQLATNPSVNGFLTYHAGITIADIDPTTGNLAENTGNTLNVANQVAASSRRWLWSVYYNYGFIQSAGTTLTAPYQNISYRPGYMNPRHVIKVNARLRPTQRVFLCEYVEQSGASDANIWRRWLKTRCLITKSK